MSTLSAGTRDTWLIVALTHFDIKVLSFGAWKTCMHACSCDSPILLQQYLTWSISSKAYTVCNQALLMVARLARLTFNKACLQVKAWPADFMRAASELWAGKNNSWTASVFEALRLTILQYVDFWCRALLDKYGSASFDSHSGSHRDSIESVSMPDVQQASLKLKSIGYTQGRLLEANGCCLLGACQNLSCNSVAKDAKLRQHATMSACVCSKIVLRWAPFTYQCHAATCSQQSAAGHCHALMYNVNVCAGCLIAV